MAKVYFYYSAMNAGKSTTLLQASYNYLERGMQTLLFSARGISRRSFNSLHQTQCGVFHARLYKAYARGDFCYFGGISKGSDEDIEKIQICT